jgi:hypothetical protein
MPGEVDRFKEMLIRGVTLGPFAQPVRGQITREPGEEPEIRPKKARIATLRNYSGKGFTRGCFFGHKQNAPDNALSSEVQGVRRRSRYRLQRDTEVIAGTERLSKTPGLCIPSVYKDYVTRSSGILIRQHHRSMIARNPEAIHP